MNASMMRNGRLGGNRLENRFCGFFKPHTLLSTFKFCACTSSKEFIWKYFIFEIRKALSVLSARHSVRVTGSRNLWLLAFPSLFCNSRLWKWEFSHWELFDVQLPFSGNTNQETVFRSPFLFLLWGQKTKVQDLPEVSPWLYNIPQ